MQSRYSPTNKGVECINHLIAQWRQLELECASKSLFPLQPRLQPRDFRFKLLSYFLRGLLFNFSLGAGRGP